MPSPPQFLSTRLSDVSDEVAKNFLSGGAGDQAGLQTLPPLALGLRFRNPWGLGSPHTPGPAAFKVPADPAAPPSLGPGIGTTATISSSFEYLPHAHQLFEPRCPPSLGSLVLLSFSCLFREGRRACPSLGTRDRRPSGRSPPLRPPGLLMLRRSRCQFCPRCRRRRRRR